MKKFFCLIAASILPILVSSQLLALEPGDIAPEIQVEKWMHGSPLSIRDGKDKNFFVVEFWATWCPTCKVSMPYLANLQKRFQGSGLLVAGISCEKEKNISDFLTQMPELDYSIGMDMKEKTYSSYMQNESGIPMAFLIGKDGKLLWKGNPVYLSRIIEKLLAGKLDVSTEKKLSGLHKKLQNDMQTQNQEEIRRTVNEILGIDPSDELAIRTMLFHFESLGQNSEALKFISEIEGKNQDSVQVFLMKLDVLMQNSPSTSRLNEEIRLAFKKFEKDTSAVSVLCDFISNELPFGTVPPSLLLPVTKQNLEKLPQDAPPELKSLSHANFAKALFLSGKPDLAVAEQEKAIAAYTDSKRIGEIKNMLEYYKDAVKSGIELASPSASKD